MPGSPSSPLAPIGPAKPSCPGGPGLPASPVAPLWPLSPRFRQRESWVCGGSSASVKGKLILPLLPKPFNVPDWPKNTWPITPSTAGPWSRHLPFLFMWTHLQNHAVRKKSFVTSQMAQTPLWGRRRSSYNLLAPFKRVEVQTHSTGFSRKLKTSLFTGGCEQRAKYCMLTEDTKKIWLMIWFDRSLVQPFWILASLLFCHFLVKQKIVMTLYIKLYVFL